MTFNGFSRRIKTDTTRPATYDYGIVYQKPTLPQLRGEGSRFGNFREKLTEWDDSMVVISGGDEIRMRVTPPKTPVPPGCKRYFILHCVGWDKDADLNTLTGQSIGPLPIREMSQYPPTVESASRFEAVQRRNSGSLQRRQSFRAVWSGSGDDEIPFVFAPKAG